MSFKIFIDYVDLMLGKLFKQLSGFASSEDTLNILIFSILSGSAMIIFAGERNPHSSSRCELVKQILINFYPSARRSFKLCRNKCFLIFNLIELTAHMNDIILHLSSFILIHALSTILRHEDHFVFFDQVRANLFNVAFSKIIDFLNMINCIDFCPVWHKLCHGSGDETWACSYIKYCRRSLKLIIQVLQRFSMQMRRWNRSAPTNMPWRILIRVINIMNISYHWLYSISALFQTIINKILPIDNFEYIEHFLVFNSFFFEKCHHSLQIWINRMVTLFQQEKLRKMFWHHECQIKEFSCVELLILFISKLHVGHIQEAFCLFTIAIFYFF